ncbi:MAG: DUF5719 family protein [bacterium]|nr:DUF5719 family protein [bacterium]MDE0600301.1 DUF5719 family protein [bacterium]
MRGVAVAMVGLALGMLTWAISVESSPSSAAAQTEAARPGSDHLVCPLTGFLRADTEVSLQAARPGTVPLWSVRDGQWSSLAGAELDEGGMWTGAAPTGNGAFLAEAGAGPSGGGISNVAPEAISAWTCGESSDRLVALGGATLADDRLDLILYNPYVLDSVVRVVVTSELGKDTPPALREIYVPAGRTVEMTLDEPLRLRRSLAVLAESAPGRIALVLRQTGKGETAMTEGVAPDDDWWLPVPDLGQEETFLVIASPSGSPFTYRVDLMTESGPLPAFVEEDFLPGQLVSIPLSAFPGGVTGIGVAGTVPLVAGLRLEGEGLLAIGPGARETSRKWFLPAAGDGAGREARAWLLNPSGLETGVSISAGSFSFTVTVPPESVLPFDLGKLRVSAEGVAGYLVEAQDEIAVVMTTQLPGGAASIAVGAPVG